MLIGPVYSGFGRIFFFLDDEFSKMKDNVVLYLLILLVYIFVFADEFA